MNSKSSNHFLFIFLFFTIGIGLFLIFSSQETVNEVDKSDLIRLTHPVADQIITSPLSIQGEARGPWYFEATFPVILTDWDGLIIAEGIATAQDDWMTEEFVPFEASLEFDKPEFGENGFLILQKSNPSGLPENDDALEIQVKFESS